jgi:hypothetical protein
LKIKILEEFRRVFRNLEISELSKLNSRKEFPFPGKFVVSGVFRNFKNISEVLKLKSQTKF